MDAHLNAGVSSHLVDDFLSCENMDGGEGVSLEWLSTFVEDCFNSEGFTSQPLPLIPTQSPINPIVSATQSSSKSSRTKRRKTNSDSTNPNFEFNSIPSSDPTLLPQPHWLAESELLIFPKKEEKEEAAAAAKATMVKINVDDDGGGDHDDDLWSDEAHGINGQRRCTHCGSHKTPQWRAGPLGPKTLCNACGVRFKSGRLLPEYRPAKSPTFESFKHSNSHKKVMEMRATSIKLA